MNGPAATGRHCPEGWTLYPFPGPNFKGATDSASSESAYYNFTDRFNLLGVGENVPLATGNQSEGVLALVDGEFHTFRVPYPLGSFFGKGLDGRIDDPDAGWKGRAIWTTSGSRAHSTPRVAPSALRRSSNSRCGRSAGALIRTLRQTALHDVRVPFGWA